MDWITDILQQWGISPVEECKKINERVYKIKCTDEKTYILKQRPYLNKLESEFYILKHLDDHDIPVPLPIQTKTGNAYVISEGRAYTLYQCLDGHPVEYNLVEDNNNLSYVYGEILGKYHYHLKQYEGSYENISVLNQERRIVNYSIEEINKKRPNCRAVKIIDSLYN